mmetsp:Transcript_8661/g.22343  ORF Transcript_8661/g.22343 Transcript_8661/m.22343 type:complete len:278 (-) Transcript_8661:1372-2205(-)
MHANDFLFYHCCQGQPVKQCIHALPNPYPSRLPEPFDALQTEPKQSVDICCFMVPPNQMYIVFVFYLQSQEQAYSLQTMRASIHVIAQEEVVDVRHIPCCHGCAEFLEEPHQVTKLAMQVAENFDWCLEMQHRWFFAENSFCGIAQIDNLARPEDECSVHGRCPVPWSQQLVQNLLVYSLEGARLLKDWGLLTKQLYTTTAYTPAFVLKLIYAQLPHQPPQGTPGAAVSRNNHCAMVQPHIRWRRALAGVLAECGGRVSRGHGAGNPVFGGDSVLKV